MQKAAASDVVVKNLQDPASATMKAEIKTASTDSKNTKISVAVDPAPTTVQKAAASDVVVKNLQDPASTTMKAEIKTASTDSKDTQNSITVDLASTTVQKAAENADPAADKPSIKDLMGHHQFKSISIYVRQKIEKEKSIVGPCLVQLFREQHQQRDLIPSLVIECPTLLAPALVLREVTYPTI